jgi:predicted transcriptional regulator
VFTNYEKGEEDMSKTLTEMAADIVKAQASHAAMSPGEMETALKKAFDSLQSIKAIEEGVAEAEPAAMDPKRSIQRTKVICLECGKEFKQLTSKHLKDHGMDAKEYRKKYGFSARQPLSAKSLSAKRRKTAEALGLGEKLQKGLRAARKAKAAAAAAAAKPAPKKAAPKKKAARKKKKS